MSQKWYMIQAQSLREKKAVELMTQKLEEKGKTHEIEFHFLEQEETIARAGKKKVVMKPIMPGYILVKMNLTDENQQIVLSTKYIKGILPGAVSESEAQALLQKLDKGDFKKDPVIDVNVGDHVKILNGPFSNFEGVVDYAEKGKVKVNVSIFGRPTPVELSPQDVIQAEKVD